MGVCTCTCCLFTVSLLYLYSCWHAWVKKGRESLWPLHVYLLLSLTTHPYANYSVPLFIFSFIHVCYVSLHVHVYSSLLVSIFFLFVIDLFILFSLSFFSLSSLSHSFLLVSVFLLFIIFSWSLSSFFLSLLSFSLFPLLWCTCTCILRRINNDLI